MAKKKSKVSRKQNVAAEKEKQEELRVTMKDLEEMSDSDDDGGDVPESQWSTKAKNLRKDIEDGKFNEFLGALKKAKEEGKGDEEEFEEDTLDSSDNDDEGSAQEEEQMQEVGEEPSEGSEEADESEGEEGKKGDEESEDEEEEEEEEREGADKIKAIFAANNEEKKGSEEESDSDDEGDEKSEKALRLIKNNEVNSKALAVVTAELEASHAGLPWAETFHIIPKTPLPFGKDAGPDSSPLDIHDDLKREVAFYNSALEAVHEARAKSKEANIPFSRPDDFFAEMIKTDDHMAKVKDRLIFETKKMDAVAQRKSNREQKLRAKESHANKLAEKSKRKREHFQEVEEWANAAARNRGSALRDDADEKFLKKGPNKKREFANKKYGFGGKTGRFKQNDRATLNDVSGFNPKGNFPGGMKKSAKSGAGAARPGKRARDSKRARR